MMEDLRIQIGAELRALRLSRGLSTRALAELAGIGYAHIARIEAGRYNLRVDTVAKIAEALGARLEIVKNDE
jgi:transcriptional regulator with XRE-family HTH domain